MYINVLLLNNVPNDTEFDWGQPQIACSLIFLSMGKKWMRHILLMNM